MVCVGVRRLMIVAFLRRVQIFLLTYLLTYLLNVAARGNRNMHELTYNKLYLCWRAWSHTVYYSCRANPDVV